VTVSNKSEYIQYRFKRSEESFEEALIMIRSSKWNTAVSRLYYSCYYAVIALLIKHNIEARSHSGVRSKFGNIFIKTGEIDVRFGKLFSRLADFRQKGDYGDLYDFDEKMVLPLVDQVKEFLFEIKNLIEK